MELRKLVSEVLRKAVLPYAKAWAVAGVFWVFGLLASFDLVVPEEIQVSVVSAVTALVVFLVPNLPNAKK